MALQVSKQSFPAQQATTDGSSTPSLKSVESLQKQRHAEIIALYRDPSNTVDEIRQAYNLTGNALYAILKEHRVPRRNRRFNKNGVSAQKIRKMRELRSKGASYSAIAKLCNASEPTVRKYTKDARVAKPVVKKPVAKKPVVKKVVPTPVIAPVSQPQPSAFKRFMNWLGF